MARNGTWNTLTETVLPRVGRRRWLSSIRCGINKYRCYPRRLLLARRWPTLPFGRGKKPVIAVLYRENLILGRPYEEAMLIPVAWSLPGRLTALSLSTSAGREWRPLANGRNRPILLKKDLHVFLFAEERMRRLNLMRPEGRAALVLTQQCQKCANFEPPKSSYLEDRLFQQNRPKTACHHSISS